MVIWRPRCAFTGSLPQPCTQPPSPIMMLGPTLSTISELLAEVLCDFPDMKYATLPSRITSPAATATLPLSDPMKVVLLLAIICSCRVSKVNVGWSGVEEGCKSGLLRGLGCSALDGGTRMGSRVEGGFTLGAGAGAGGVAGFAAGAGA